MAPKDADRMANSVDPDQTAPLLLWSSLIWVYTVARGHLSENLLTLWYSDFWKKGCEFEGKGLWILKKKQILR